MLNTFPARPTAASYSAASEPRRRPGRSGAGGPRGDRTDRSTHEPGRGGSTTTGARRLGPAVAHTIPGRPTSTSCSVSHSLHSPWSCSCSPRRAPVRRPAGQPGPPVPGALTHAYAYADTWRGWPVTPLHRQHPIRGSLDDPRPSGYHIGLDISVRDDLPEAGAPRAGRIASMRSRAERCRWRRMSPRSAA